jgi:hypothetical protein
MIWSDASGTSIAPWTGGEMKKPHARFIWIVFAVELIFLICT